MNRYRVKGPPGTSSIYSNIWIKLKIVKLHPPDEHNKRQKIPSTRENVE